MLSWLKRKARGTIVNSRIINLLRRPNIDAEMFVSDPNFTLLDQQNVKLTVLNDEGIEYPLVVSSETNIGRLMQMALGHFRSPEVFNDFVKGDGGSLVGRQKYKLVLVREARVLSDDATVHFEQLLDNDELLLIEKRICPPSVVTDDSIYAAPTKAQIAAVTANVHSKNQNTETESTHHVSDFQLELRRILISLIEVSVRLISADIESEDVFAQVLEKLERRHRPKVDRSSLKQLVEMGFSEARATKALNLKRTLNDAMEWLLEQTNLAVASEAGESPGESNDSIHELLAAHKKGADEMEDPAMRFLAVFQDLRKKWFQPNMKHLQYFRQVGFDEGHILEALWITNNNEEKTLDLLANRQWRNKIETDASSVPLERDSPIISAILASPVVQLALPKPKALLALLMLYESPNNANMWLSDPDTHPLVSQVLRIYHAEKHCQPWRTPPTPGGTRGGRGASDLVSSRRSIGGRGSPSVLPPTQTPLSLEPNLLNSRRFLTSSLNPPTPPSVASYNGEGLYGNWLAGGWQSPSVPASASPNTSPYHMSSYRASEPMSQSGSPIMQGISMPPQPLRQPQDPQSDRGGGQELRVTMVPPENGQPAMFSVSLGPVRSVNPYLRQRADVDMEARDSQDMDME